jgi:hypothetical protein
MLIIHPKGDGLAVGAGQERRVDWVRGDRTGQRKRRKAPR